MTFQGIGERLYLEFPGRHVALVIKVDVCWDGRIYSTMSFYTDKTKVVDGFKTLDEGIQLLKRKLGMLPSGEKFDLDVEAAT